MYLLKFSQKIQILIDFILKIFRSNSYFFFDKY